MLMWFNVVPPVFQDDQETGFQCCYVANVKEDLTAGIIEPPYLYQFKAVPYAAHMYCGLNLI